MNDRAILAKQHKPSNQDRHLRAPIIAGLMAVMLTGCGGTELATSAETATNVVRAAEWCHRCDMSYDYCMEFASTREEKVQCSRERQECYEAGQCPTRQGSIDEGRSGGTEAAYRQIHAAGLPPDNICHIECWGGPAAGTTAAPYAANLQECFAYANSICAVPDGGWYGLTYNGQQWAN